MLVTAGGLLSVLVSGCGEESGVAGDATVTTYVVAPLCVEAKRALARENGRAGSVQVRAVCLSDARRGSRLDLAVVGANARRASEDSATVAYIEAPTTPSFSRSIVEAANIPVIRSSSGEAAMGQLLSAIAEADSGSLRDSVREALR